jgi:hypothetical protein
MGLRGVKLSRRARLRATANLRIFDQQVVKIGPVKTLQVSVSGGVEP